MVQILAKEGDTVKAGTAIARVSEGAAGAPSAPPPKEEPASPPKESEKSVPPLPPKTAAASGASSVNNKDAPAPPPPQPKTPPPPQPKTPPPSPAQPKSTSGTEVHLPTKGGERRVSSSLVIYQELFVYCDMDVCAKRLHIYLLFRFQVPMTRLRKRVATRLKDSQNTFALLTTFNEIDM
jgi:2-oxoglutarate dehydrogenase E2 component (dihydrolipoamide succinyltransferase)